uniref:IKAROS family zinc finger 4 n=1 Tax=Oryzias latipes TaxID=8090 RepID=A0A3P9K7Q0_ORYLA
MDVDDCNGPSYTSASGESSMENEFSGALGGPTVSTPNSKDNSPTRSLSANSIKIELYSDDDPEVERGERLEDRGTRQRSESGENFRELANPETMPAGAARLPNGKLKCDICGMICIGPNVLMVHKRSHTGERPFQCNQCGASFTQKGNLLRHIKLHSGEKPFKCPFCSYACRRRDALTGHLRTHAVSSPTVGKPYKCSYCGRSYKQHSTLEEHRERCQSYLQSLESQLPNNAYTPGEEMRELEFIPDSLLQSSSNKMVFIDRLANAVTKRKRSTPQKFVGQKHIRLNPADAPYELSAELDKDGEMHRGDLESLYVGGLGGEYPGVAGNVGGGTSETLRPPHLPTTHHACPSDIRLPHNSNHPAVSLGGREAAEGHEDVSAGPSHVPSPSNGCQESTDTESMPDEHSLSNAKERDVKNEEGRHSALAPPPLAAVPVSLTAHSATSTEALRVVDGEGHVVRSFRCDHCRVIFLDHVMFTIHMGCHGFRQPFECNICGYRSQDRYEFSSHIVRGEHVFE